MESDADTRFRIYAISALTGANPRLGLVRVAKPAIPVLLRMAVQQAVDDPRKVLQHDIGRALFHNEHNQRRSGLVDKYGLDGVDRSLLIPAIKEILTNKNGWARSTLSNFVYPRLTLDECNQLWGDIYQATRYIAPSGIMFASEVRTDGLKLMARHKVEEGIYLAAWYIRGQKGHGAPRRIPIALEALEEYGAAAQSVLPYLQEEYEHFKTRRKAGKENDPNDTANRIAATMERIKASEDHPALISIADFLNQADMPDWGSR
jgi:hypothetical protein